MPSNELQNQSQKSRAVFPRLLVIACLALTLGCNASVSDLVDVVDGVPRKTIDVSKLGINAFANDSRFGSVASQLADVPNTLGLKYIRVLFRWDDAVQPSPSAKLNYSLFDSIAGNIPSGVDALVVLTGLPTWMNASVNWTDGNPRKTFVERWVAPVSKRYKSNGRIIGFQVWNEPNSALFPENDVLDVRTSPDNYLELLALAQNEIKANAPGKLVVNGATTAINQNFPDTLRYDQDLTDGGGQEFVDVWAVHYYGKQFENVVRSGGVENYLESLSRPIWITEIGAQGVNSQLAYGEQVWPFLLDKISGIQRIYVYQLTEDTASNVTYGLRNLDSAAPVSDLYVYLRDLPR